MIRLFVLLLLLATYSHAQDGNYSMGARNSGMAGASSTHTDYSALFNNIGSMGMLKTSGALVSYQNRYAIKSFQVVGAALVMHSKHVNAGLKYFKFGDDLFSQQLVGIAFANQFQKVSIGVGFNLLQTAVEGQQTDRKLAFELGGKAKITSNLLFAAYIFNFRHTHYYPTTMKAGISFLPTEGIRLTMEVEKQLATEELLKFGLEYYLIKNLAIRTGINVQRNPIGRNETTSALGLGLNPGRFRFDYAFTTASLLGAIHEISMTFHFTNE